MRVLLTALVPLVLLGALWAGPARAQLAGGLGLGSDAPISVDADEIEAFEREDRVVATGGVRVAQGPALLTADRVEVTFYPGTQDFRLIEGEGQVRYASGEDAVSGRAATFDAETGTLVVTGDVVVVQGEQVVVGDRLVYDTQTGALSFSAGEGGRVRGLFVPGGEDDDEPAAPPATGLR